MTGSGNGTFRGPERPTSFVPGSRIRRIGAVVVAALFLLTAFQAPALEIGDIELTTPVLQNLKRLQETWGEWTRAYLQGDQEAADASAEQLLAIAQYLGATKLPDLAIACAGLAARAAEEGQLEQAGWALDAARKLDPGRPETDFAAAAVARASGDYLGVLGHLAAGQGKLLDLAIESRIWKQIVGLWLVYLLILAGGIYLALLMIFHGSSLFYDLGRLASPPLPPAGADVVAVLLLLWPILLPSGVLWLALYWSILLWGYGSSSQRGVLVGLWLLLGLLPLAVIHQQREVQSALLPPSRVVDNLRTNSLHGSLFLDLEVLRSVMSESPIVTELVADLHRDFGQWEHARLIYSGLIEGDGGPEVAAALNNLGVYHHRKGDYGTAINYFLEAAESDPSRAEPYFNLNQAHSQNFNFTEAHQAMAQAKQINAARVAAWEASEGGAEGNVIPIEGGLEHATDLLAAIDAASRESAASNRTAWRRYLSLSVALAALAIAVALHFLRRQKGYPSSKFNGTPSFSGNRFLRILVPGWESTVEGDGLKALAAILLPLGFLLVPLVRVWGYRVPLGYDAGLGLASILALVGLLVVYAVRAGWVLRHRSSAARLGKT